jgi:ribosomal protein RSM22 (predicted rRNA methylase)
MRLPEELQIAIDQVVEKTPTRVLAKAREALTKDYKEGKVSLFNDEEKRLVYLASRMPATFAAVYKVLQNLSGPFDHFLDIGAGPGTASWAAIELFPDLKKITLIEKSPEAIALGKELFRGSSSGVAREWIQRGLPGEIPRANIAVLSYVLNEVPDREKVVMDAWNAVDVLTIIEPGSKKGAGIIRELRKMLLEQGAYVIAPCPHSLACPSDWCHFSARIERTRLHRLVKGGSLGHEDEKFSYFIASKQKELLCENRIIRHPIKGSGYVKLTLCTANGMLEEKVVARSNKELYRKARDAKWGDPF